jgi:thiamine biosynthesis lipoprotein
MHVLSRLRVALGTFVAVEAEAASEPAVERGIAAALEAVVRIEGLMHPERPGSDLVSLSESAPGTVLSIDQWTWEVLELCRELHRVSQGTFDPCLDLAPGRMTDIELLDGLRIRANAPVRVDLGGVAKGYAVDRAVEALRGAGCEGGLVNAGGDLAVFGGRGRTLYCGAPHGPTTAVHLRDAALATSDTNSLSRPAQHRGYYHGSSRQKAISGRVSVIAPRAAVADGLTKCLLAADGVASQPMLDAFGARQVL